MKRFYFVASPRSDVIHRSETLTEGNRTYCGISLRLGWAWWRATRRRIVQMKPRRCLRCERA